MRALFMAGVTVSALFAADVVPHCGPPRREIRELGQDCGPEGPRRYGECVSPAICISVGGQGARCTLTCASDKDCAPMGPRFACSGAGPTSPGSPTARKKVCGEQPRDE